MNYKVYYDLRQLIKDLTYLKNITLIVPGEVEYKISKLDTYEYRDFKEKLKKQNIKISFLKKGNKNEYNKNIKI